MRRAIVIVLAAVFLQLASPRPAAAWWDYIEQLSGPGPLRGVDVESRVVCLVRREGTPGLTKAALVPVVGVIVNFCDIPKDARRVLSLDFGVRWTTRGDDPRWAGGERISMMTFVPALTWNAINDPNWDVFELGVGAGMYWFHSRGFDDFVGVVIDPRVDFHLPTVLQTRGWYFRPVFRFGALVFPEGLRAEQFAAAPGLMIHERAAKYGAFYFKLSAD